MSSDPLLQPFRLKHLELKNRLMISAHEPNYHEDGMPKDRYRAYHVERAKGGVALTMTAGSAVVSRDSPPAFGNLLAWQDEIVPWMRKLTDECHDHGCAVMIQLTHLGRRTLHSQSDWLPTVSASPVREAAHRSFPKEAEDWDIDRIVTDYADAAERMQAAGLDGIEIESYGHFFDSFFSPATNHRNDEYGGSLDNRMRFGRRVLDAIRDRVGPGFIVGLRIVADENWDQGLSRAEGVEICRRFRDTGQVDFLNIIRGHIDHDAPLADVIPVTGMRSAPSLDFAGDVRAETGIATFHAARIADTATARHAIAEGKLDMVAMTRAHIAEPHIARHVVEGTEARIRPCVGATYCLDRIYEGDSATCIHNPSTGRELAHPHALGQADTPRKIAVVGAGPGGLECARVAAERGHRVTLFEAAPKAGGQVRLAANLKRRAEMLGLIEWRVEECTRLGVDMRFNAFVEESDVLADAPDIVVVATGGLPKTDCVAEGADLAVTSWDILSGDVTPAGELLILDDNGGHQAPIAAEYAAEAGARVTYLTPERNIAPDVGGLNLVPYIRAFERLGVTVKPLTGIRKLSRQGNRIEAVLHSPYTLADSGTLQADMVVVENGTAPLDDLYHALKPGSVNLGAVDYHAFAENRPQTLAPNPAGAYKLFRIGDAVASRNIHAAIFDGLRFARAF